MMTTRISDYERLYCDARRAGLVVLVEIEPAPAMPRLDQPRLRISVARGEDIVDESPWVEAGDALNRASVGTLARLAGTGLL